MEENCFGFTLDEMRLLSVSYADDIILIGASKSQLEQMLRDLVEAFGNVGLTFGAPKTHWTSLPAAPMDKIKVEDCEVEWEASITFVGTIIDLTGSAAAAMQHRINQGNKVYHKWKPILVAKWLRCSSRPCGQVCFGARPRGTRPRRRERRWTLGAHGWCPRWRG
jgi:hypothetical protein